MELEEQLENVFEVIYQHHIHRGLSTSSGIETVKRVLRELVETEREECAKIGDEFWEKHYQTESGCFVNPSGAAKLAVSEVARKIRARGEKKP